MNVTIGVHNSCDFDGCKDAHIRAQEFLKMLIPEICYDYIISEPPECVKYDCNSPTMTTGVP